MDSEYPDGCGRFTRSGHRRRSRTAVIGLFVLLRRRDNVYDQHRPRPEIAEICERKSGFGCTLTRLMADRPRLCPR